MFGLKWRDVGFGMDGRCTNFLILIAKAMIVCILFDMDGF